MDIKKKDQEKEQIEKKQGGVYFQFNLPTIEEKKESIDEKNSPLMKSPSKTTQKSVGKKEEEEEEEKQKKKEEFERKKYGVRNHV